VSEIRRHVAGMKSLEKITAVELQSGLHPSLVQSSFERPDITTELLAINPDFLISTTYEGLGSELLPEDIQGFAKRRPPSLGVQLRPEKGKQRVSALEAIWPSKGDIKEECESLRLPQNRLSDGAVGSQQIDGSQGAQVDAQAATPSRNGDSIHPNYNEPPESAQTSVDGTRPNAVFYRSCG